MYFVVADFEEHSCPPAGRHGTAKRESADGVPPNPALKYALCYVAFFIIFWSIEYAI
jgi:hypothetical protein